MLGGSDRYLHPMSPCTLDNLCLKLAIQVVNQAKFALS